MTSGTFQSIPIAAIQVERHKRQRTEIDHAYIQDLASSIQRLGLIHPIVITHGMELVAGESRLLACKLLGWTSITTQYQEDADEATLQEIELEENIKRRDISWQDQCRALLSYHNLRVNTDIEWSKPKTAAALGYSYEDAFERIQVAEELVKGNSQVIAAERYSIAKGVVKRANERARDSELVLVRDIIGTPLSPNSMQKALAAAVTSVPTKEPEVILHDNFLTWAPRYSGPKFNLIHCDFPYGINFDTSDQAHSEAKGAYKDTEDTYWDLLDCLSDNLDRICAPSAHMIFWFSMKHYEATHEYFRENFPDFTVDEFPLIWHKTDGRGIIPDAQRGPRRTYETALFCTRGDRKVISAVANSYAGPTAPRDESIHISEKPEPMLRHFLRMVCDANTVMLDPTCGSGSALRAAKSLSANHLLGLEMNEDYAKWANASYRQSLQLKRISLS
jgi:ParB/RepB/Spo0J family partition protein